MTMFKRIVFTVLALQLSKGSAAAMQQQQRRRPQQQQPATPVQKKPQPIQTRKAPSVPAPLPYKKPQVQQPKRYTPTKTITAKPKVKPKAVQSTTTPSSHTAPQKKTSLAVKKTIKPATKIKTTQRVSYNQSYNGRSTSNLRSSTNMYGYTYSPYNSRLYGSSYSYDYYPYYNDYSLYKKKKLGWTEYLGNLVRSVFDGISGGISTIGRAFTYEPTVNWKTTYQTTRRVNNIKRTVTHNNDLRWKPTYEKTINQVSRDPHRVIDITKQ